MTKQAMYKPALKILYLEDSRRDIEIIRELLTDAGYDLSMDCTGKEKEYVSLLRERTYDVILSDFTLPGVDAFGALKLAISISPQVPFICVSGSIGEETAVELVKRGAADYVLKDRILRLPSAIERALGDVKKKETLRRAEEALNESEERFHRLFAASPDALMVMDPFDTSVDWPIIDCNEAACRMNGYTREELIGKSINILNVSEGTPQERAAYMESIRREGVLHLESSHRHKDGHVFPIEISTSFITSKGRELLLGIDRDITERKRSEEAIRESEEKFRMVFENVIDGICIYDLDPDPNKRKLIECNDRYAALAGRSREELLRRANTQDLQIPLESTTNINRLESLAKGTTFQGSFSWIRPDGKDNIIEYVGVPITWQGKPFSIGIDRDVTERRQAEKRLKQALEWQEAIFEGSRDSIFISDQNSKFVAVNNAACELTGCSREQLLTMRIPDLHDQPDLDAYNAYRQDIFEGKEIVSEAKILRRDGSKVDTEFNNRRVMIEGIPYMHTTARNITERKRAEEELIKNETLLRTSVENLPLIFYVIDPSGTFKLSIGAGLNGLGLKPNQVTGQSAFDVYKDFPAITDSIKRSLAGESVEFESTVSGSSFANFLVPFSFVKGTFAGIVGVALDITERKQTEQKANQLAAIVQSSEDAIISKTLDGIIVSWNKGAEKIYGYSENEMIGKPIAMLIPAGHENEVPEILKKIKSGEYIRQYETMRRKKNGQLIHMSLAVSPIRDPDGRIIAASTIGRDVTERRQTEEELRKLNQKDKDALRVARMGHWEFDVSTAQFTFNNQYYVLHGTTAEEEGGYLMSAEKFTSKYVHPDDAHWVEQEIQRARETDDPNFQIQRELRIRQADGQPRDVSVWFRIEKDPQGRTTRLFGVTQDITERKRAVEALRNERLLLRTLIDNLPDAIYAKDVSCRKTLANSAELHIMGVKSEAEVLGKDDFEFYPKELAEAFFADDQSVLQTGQPVLNREEYVLDEKGEKRWLLTSKLPLRDEQGHIFGLVGVGRDVTELKYADRMKSSLETQLQQAQKLESIGTLASGIAHDFNNILGIILGHSSLLERLREDANMHSESVAAITKATQRGASLVKQLMLFARKAEPLLESVKVNNIIGELTRLLQETFPKTVNISTALQRDLPSIIADSSQIHQVLLNLLVNARDAMPKGGTISIATSTIEGEAVSSRFAKAAARQYVKVEIADTGIGMDEATRQRIFEPFFTTKGPGKGTGLGLAVVFGIVEYHNGFIDVRSALGEGTRFDVYLPVPEHTGEETHTAGKELVDMPGGTETVLIIEDEEMLRSLAKGILVSKGYTVFTAEDGMQGVELYRNHQKEIAVVLSDIGLPILGGHDVFRKILAINPKAKIIFASGYFDPETKSEMFKAGLKNFIQKPYMHDEVLRKIREAIDTK